MITIGLGKTKREVLELLSWVGGGACIIMESLDSLELRNKRGFVLENSEESIFRALLNSNAKVQTLAVLAC